MDDLLNELEEKEADEDLDAMRCGLEQSLQDLGRPAMDFFKEFEAEQSL